MPDRFDETAPATPGEQLGDFLLLDIIGAGTTGTVYRARQISMDREVAVKILHEHLASNSALLERFRREAQVTGRLRHNNVVAGIQAGEAGGKKFFAMELAEGEGLDAILERRGRLPLPEAMDLLRQIAGALEYAHARGITHRDLKPSNVVVDRAGNAKVTDLGLAAAINDAVRITQQGGLIGTPAYMAPEQVRDASSADERSDLYSLGVTFYEMLTGELPIEEASRDELFVAKRKGIFRPVRDVVPELDGSIDRIVARLLNPEPGRRFQRASELLDVLDDPKHSVAAENAKRGLGRRRVAGLLGVAFVVLATIFSQFFMSSQSTNPSDRPPPIGESANLAAVAARTDIAVSGAVSPGPVTFGVMSFKTLGARSDLEEWGETVRDELNTILSEIKSVKVYSKEFIDFLVTRKGMSEIEVAKELGISKFLSGRLIEQGDILKIETHVVDVVSGVLDASFTTAGASSNFLDLQRRFAIATVENLELRLSGVERAKLAQRGEADALDLRNLMLESEGAPGGIAMLPDEPLSWLGGRFDLWALCTFLQPSSAFADEDLTAGGEPSAEDEIRELLEAYRLATEAREIEELAALYVDLPDAQRQAQSRYFENVEKLKVVFDELDVAVAGDEAVVSFTRVDDFVDRRTGREMHFSVRLTKLLRRADDGWRLSGTAMQ